MDASNSDIALRRYTPSQADVAVFKGISAAPDATAFPSVARWYSHIKSYEPEFGSLSGSSQAGEAFLGGSSEAAAPAKAEEDDDDVDLFGSDDDEEDAEAERIKAEVDPTPGAEVQKFALDIISAPKDIVERANKAME